MFTNIEGGGKGGAGSPLTDCNFFGSKSDKIADIMPYNSGKITNCKQKRQKSNSF